MRIETLQGGGRLTDEEVYQMYLNTLNNMPEYLSGDYVLGMTSYLENYQGSQGSKIIGAFDGVNLDSYYTLESSYTDKNNPDDPYSSDWTYNYVQKENGEYVGYTITGGEVTKDTIEDGSADDINDMFNEEYYSGILDIMRQGDGEYFPEPLDSIEEYISQLKETCYGMDFSEDVVNRGVYYTLTYSGGLYHLKFVVNCTEYVYNYDFNWCELKISYEIAFDENMVRKIEMKQSMRAGTAPDGFLLVDYRFELGYIIDHYSPNYRPDLSGFVPTN